METKGSQNEELRCKYFKCNKIISDYRKIKYCSELCRIRDSTRRQYERLKNDKDYIKKRNEKNRKYYQEHKEELKPRMRIYGMKYFFKKRDEKRVFDNEKKKHEGEIEK